jgi:hypothetical protein
MSSDPEFIQHVSAVGFLVNNPLARMVANFFIGINKPPRPTKLFTDMESAVEWLSTYLPAGAQKENRVG